jgi:methyl-accepting chemotaxis protein
MHNWTIKKQITLGLAILILINIVVGIFTSMGISKLKSFVQNISTSQLRGVYELGQIQSKENDAYDLMLHHILAETKEDTTSYDARLTDCSMDIEKLLADYAHVPFFTEHEKAMFAKVREDHDAFNAAWTPVRDLSLSLQNKEAFAQFKTQVEPAITRLKTSLQEEIDYNKQIADAATDESIAVTDHTSTGINLSIVVMLSACIAIAFVIVRSLNRVLTSVANTLGEGANQIVAASGQLAAASQSLAQGANEQAASLEETSAALEQIGSMTKRNSESAHSAQALASETREAAENCAHRTEEMQSAMKAISKASTEMAVAIHGITTSSNSISKIISTIEEIAFQTNILALNAAVEAARAGEAGMGFGVVADEVRNLAKRSAEAAKETASMIEAAVTQSQLGVEVNGRVTARIAEVVQSANGVRDSLTHIVSKAREVDSVVSQITEASKEQNSGLEQINSAINLMNQVTQANAVGSEQTASASEELTAQSMELRTGVDVLVKLVNGKSFADAPKLAPLPATTRAVEPHPRKAEMPPVKAIEIPRRKPTTAVYSASNGHGNGNGNGNGKVNGNGNGHSNGLVRNDDDEFFFDM